MNRDRWFVFRRRSRAQDVLLERWRRQDQLRLEQQRVWQAWSGCLMLVVAVQHAERLGADEQPYLRWGKFSLRPLPEWEGGRGYRKVAAEFELPR